MSMRNRPDEGAAAVEFALVLPLLLMLIFGGITAGLALDARQQTNHAAREGSRYGATLPNGTNPCGAGTTWHTCVIDRTRAAAVNSLTFPRDGICVSLITTVNDAEVASSAYAGSLAGGDVDEPCFDETPVVTGERVQVRIERDADINVIFFQPSVTMVSEAVSAFEAGGS